MKTKQLIDKLNKFFVQKLINEDYEIIDIDEYTVRVEIDNEYSFTFWIANQPNNFIVYNNSNNMSKMDLEFSVHEQEILHKRFNNITPESNESKHHLQMKEIRRKRYMQLKEEFEG